MQYLDSGRIMRARILSRLNNVTYKKILDYTFLIIILHAFFVTSIIPTVLGGVYWKYKTDGTVNSVGVSADGNYMVAGTWNESVFLFDGNGSLLWSHHFAVDVECVAISGDGSRIVVGIHEYQSGKPDIYLFDNLGNIIWQKDIVEDVPRDIAISPDGKYTVAGDRYHTVYFYDAYGSSIWKYAIGNLVDAVSVSAEGEYTAAGSWDKSLYFFDKAGNLLWSHEFEFFVNAVSVSPEGEYVAAGSWSEDLFLFDKNGNLLLKTPFYISIEAVSLSANADRIAVAAHERVNVIDKAANMIFELKIDQSAEDIAITADGRFVAFGCGNYVYFLEALPPSEITCRVTPEMIFLGDSITLNGSIKPPISGVQVKLEYKLIVQDSTWREEGFVNVTRTVMTLADGSFTDVFTPNDVGRWEISAFWSGGAEYMASEAKAFFGVNPDVETSLLSTTPVTLYWTREQWYCMEYFPSTPPEYSRHYFLSLETLTSNESKRIGFDPDGFLWLGHPEWSYWGAHIKPLSEDTLIEGGLWNLSLWVSASGSDQHSIVQLCYWDENHDFNFIAGWNTGHINSTSLETPVQLTHFFGLPAKIIPKGSCLGFVIVVGPDSDVNLFFDSTLHPSYLIIPPSTEVLNYNLTITTTTGGTTTPNPSTYTYVSGTEVTVTAIPEEGYSFDHWELDGINIASANPVDILMDNNHTLLAVFVDDIPPEIGAPAQDPPQNIQPGQNVTVIVTVSDHGSGVYNVTLWYSVNNGTTWTPLNMIETDVNSYQTKIHGYENCTWVRYKITAYDNNGNQAENDNDGYYYIYHVIPEFPSALILPLFMIATLLVLIVYRRKHSI